MGLEQVDWGETRCDERTYPPFAHHWVSVAIVDKGTTFMCKFCHRIRWYPNSWQEVIVFDNLSDRLGIDEAYRTILADHPVAAAQIARLNDLRSIRKVVTDDDQFRSIVVVVSKIGDYLHQDDLQD